MKTLGLILLLIIFGYQHSWAQLPKIDFERAHSEQEIINLHRGISTIIAHPQETAKAIHEKLQASSVFFLDSEWVTILKAFDLMAYYFELEKAQFYASAGRFKVPPHSNPEHYAYYLSTLNPNAQPYSGGVLQEPFYAFAQALFSYLMIPANHDRASALLSYMLNSKREFWNFVVIRYLVANPVSSTQLVQNIIPHIALNRYHSLADTILSRMDKHTLLASVIHRLNAHSAIQGENAIKKYIFLEHFADCGELFTAVQRDIADSAPEKKASPDNTQFFDKIKY